MKPEYKTLFFQLLLFIQIHFTFAQQGVLRGIVTEVSTNEPLHNTTVAIKETGYSQITDSTGSFLFSSLPSGWYTIIATHNTHNRFEQRVYCDGESVVSVTIELTPLIYSIPPVVVQSMRLHTKAELSPYPVSVFDGNRINTTSPQTIAEALSKTSSIALMRDGMWATTVNIRGMSRYDVVYINDGVRVETAQDLAAGMSLINPYELDRIEIVKGPTHAGTGTIGGVIQSSSKVPSFKDELSWNLQALTRYESVNNLHAEHLATEIASDVFRLRASGIYRKADSYKTPDGIMLNSQFKDFGGTFFGGVKLFNSHLFNLSYQRFQAENVGIPGGKSIAPTATATYRLAKRELIKTEYTIPNISPSVPLLNIQLAQQLIQRNVQLIASPTITKTPHASHTMNSVKAEGSFIPLTNHFSTAGIEVWQRRIVSERESYDKARKTITLEKPLPNATYTSIGFFVQDEWRLLPTTSLTFGGRYDAIRIQNPTTYDVEWIIDSLNIKTIPPSQRLLWNEATRTTESWNMNIGIHQQLLQNLRSSILFAAAERAATVEERFQFLSLGPRTFLGNPDLASERSYNTNIAFQWYYGSFVFRGDLFSHFFVNLISDTLTLSNATTQTFSKYNIRRAKIYGYELTAEWASGSNLSLISTLTYTRGEDFSHKTHLPQIPPLRGTMTVQYSFPSFTTASIEIESVADQNLVAAQTAGEIRTGGYTLYHFNIASVPINLSSISLIFRGGVNNIFNKAYRNHLSTFRILKLEPGRNVWLSLTAEY